MELAIDLELDLPKVWTCLAELVAHIFHHTTDSVALSSITDMAQPLLAEQKAGIFVIETLKQLLEYAVSFFQTRFSKIKNQFFTILPVFRRSV